MRGQGVADQIRSHSQPTLSHRTAVFININLNRTTSKTFFSSHSELGMVFHPFLVTQKGSFLEGKNLCGDKRRVSSHDRGAPCSQFHGINFAFTGMKTKMQERSSNIKSTIRLAGATSVLYTALHTAITR